MLTIGVVSLDGELVATPIHASFGHRGGTIGRSNVSDLVLDDPDRQISRIHAAVEEREGRFVIRAIGVNPTVLNGRTLRPDEASPLVPGDRIRIGGYLLEVTAETHQASDSRRTASADGARDELLRAFLDGAGIRHLEIPGGLTPEVMRTLGEILHATLQGTLDLMATRRGLKTELRVHVPTISAAPVNPLKFAPTVDDAIADLLVPQSGGRMQAMPAVKDAYSELRAQQAASISAIRSAFEGTQLTPHQLERRLTEKDPIRSLLAVSRKAILWDRLVAHHQEIADEAQEHFQAQFEAEFRKVYEQELAKDADARSPPPDPQQAKGGEAQVQGLQGLQTDSPFSDPLAGPPSGAPFADILPTVSTPAEHRYDPFGLPASDDRTVLIPPANPSPREDVKLGVAAPSSATPGQQFIAHFVAYPAGQEAEVLGLIEAQSPSLKPVLGKRTCRWKPGTEVKVSLSGDHLEFDHAEQRFVWSGSVESLDFSGRVKIDAPNCDIVLKYDVFVADFLVAAICLPMRLSREALSVQTVSATTHAARTGFASYSSNDRTLVTHMVGAIERSAGIAVFQDCLDLKASEAWKPRLTKEIGSRDLFFLFWSHSAAESTWVEWEWKTALQEKGKAAMRIHPLEPDVKPPSALEDLHFADVHSIVASYFSRAASAAEAKRTS